MGAITITEGEEIRELPLAATTALGRHGSCTWGLQTAQVPTFWIELRWTTHTWAWRELGGDALGPRRQVTGLGTEWWQLEPGQRISGRGVVVELSDPSPPQRFVVDTQSNEVISGKRLDKLVAADTARPMPADWETRDVAVSSLADGDIFTVRGRSYRFHEASPPQPTSQRQLDLLRPSCSLELRVEDGRPVLEIWDGPVERKAKGSTLWALVPYLEARLEDIPRGGWLPLDEAHSRWQELCPRSKSGPDRVGLDRSRVCRALHSLGVVNPHALFARQKTEDRWLVRLDLDPDRLELEL